jgi:hypothetical protein
MLYAVEPKGDGAQCEHFAKSQQTDFLDPGKSAPETAEPWICCIKRRRKATRRIKAEVRSKQSPKNLRPSRAKLNKREITHFSERYRERGGCAPLWCGHLRGGGPCRLTLRSFSPSRGASLKPRTGGTAFRGVTLRLLLRQKSPELRQLRRLRVKSTGLGSWERKRRERGRNRRRNIASRPRP